MLEILSAAAGETTGHPAIDGDMKRAL